jgi:hypothetical protein|tara:strand:+ start:254 stop:505 length:252 start_codon:yes stop_codon:yes gene_type:complete
MICEAILKIKADAQVSVLGKDIDTCTITWHDGNPTGITKDQIKEQISNVEQDEQDKINLKASAKAKLVAGEPLTQEEADTIVL